MAQEWCVFRGEDNPEGEGDRLRALPDPPPWRVLSQTEDGRSNLDDWRGKTYRPGVAEIEGVNAALYLRRPLLVTGPPGAGKSSLIYAVAQELRLGPVLRWSINSRSSLAEGLYQYDAIARLRDAQMARDRRVDTRGGERPDAETTEEDIGRYLKLGPLGTALLPRAPEAGVVRPRALLIDEIDKSDIDLPNDLLHVFEEGYYEIPELVRVAERQAEVRVRPYLGRSDADRVPIQHGRVNCTCFPLVVLTSNRERDLPPAFYRRCLRLDLDKPTPDELEQIVERHLQALAGYNAKDVRTWVAGFVKRREQEGGQLATDQLLNLVYLLCGGASARQPVPDGVQKLVQRRLSEE